MKKEETKLNPIEVLEKFMELMRTDENDSVENYTEVVSQLSQKYGVPESRINRELKELGISKRTHGSKSDSRLMPKMERNAKIIELYMAGKDPSTIALEVGLTHTRVGQIVREHLGKHVRNNSLEPLLDEIKLDIESGMSHKDIMDKHGASVLRKIKSNLGFNVFDACVSKRNDEIYQEHKRSGKTAMELAEQYGLTRDHVYGILHKYGVRTKPTKQEYDERNRSIVELFLAGKTSFDIALEYDMTVTNVNIILANKGARKMKNSKIKK
jgi:DNA-binding NarL/FixJ family response regulator